MKHRPLPAFLALLLCASVVLAAPKAGDFFTSGPGDARRIALTFDDGPGPYTEKVLALLDQYQVKATFFMLAEQAQYQGARARAVADKGHEVASHTFDHKNYLQVYKAELKKQTGDAAADKAAAETRAKLAAEMKKSREILEKATGAKLTLLRMPHGVDRPWVKEAARQTGFVLANWTYGADWLTQPEAQVTAGYLKAVKPGAILLFHDGGSRRDKTLAYTEAVLREAKEKGYEVVTLSELLGLVK